MELLTFDFVRDAKPNSIWNSIWDRNEPNTVYSLVNPSEQNLRIEFIGDLNCSVIKDSESVFHLSPPKKTISFKGEVIISDKDLTKIGWYENWGWTFKKKKVIIHHSNIHEEWTLKRESIFSSKFWSSSLNSTILENGEKTISLELEASKPQSIMDRGNTIQNLRIRFPHSLYDNSPLMCGLIIYMHELRVLEWRDR